MRKVAAIGALALLFVGGTYAATTVTEYHTWTATVTQQGQGRMAFLTLSGTITDVDTLPDPVTVTVTAPTTTTVPPPTTTAPVDTQPPATPVLSLGPATQTTLTLSWLPGVDNVGVVRYDVYRGTGPTSSAQTKIAETTALTYTYTGLACNTSYSLGLVAVDAAGNRSNLAYAIWYPVSTLACSTTTTTTTPTQPPPSAGTANLWVAP